jgi:hypothetical protein
LPLIGMRRLDAAGAAFGVTKTDIDARRHSNRRGRSLLAWIRAEVKIHYTIQIKRLLKINKRDFV